MRRGKTDVCYIRPRILFAVQNDPTTVQVVTIDPLDMAGRCLPGRPNSDVLADLVFRQVRWTFVPTHGTNVAPVVHNGRSTVDRGGRNPLPAIGKLVLRAVIGRDDGQFG